MDQRLAAAHEGIYLPPCLMDQFGFAILRVHGHDSPISGRIPGRLKIKNKKTPILGRMHGIIIGSWAGAFPNPFHYYRRIDPGYHVRVHIRAHKVCLLDVVDVSRRFLDLDISLCIIRSLCWFQKAALVS